MIRALLTISCMLVLLWWLRFEFRRPVSLKKHLIWLIAALVVQFISNVISLLITDRVFGNLLYHGIGGGVTSTLLFIYLLKTYSQAYSWRVELVLLYGFVSGLGVLNELTEYAGEFAIKVGIFSWDSHDTWRDLAANTTGAIIAWLLYRGCTFVYTKHRKQQDIKI